MDNVIMERSRSMDVSPYLLRYYSNNYWYLKKAITANWQVHNKKKNIKLCE